MHLQGALLLGDDTALATVILPVEEGYFADTGTLMPRSREESRLVLTGEEWVVAAARIDRPPTSDDVTITLDGAAPRQQGKAPRVAGRNRSGPSSRSNGCRQPHLSLSLLTSPGWSSPSIATASTISSSAESPLPTIAASWPSTVPVYRSKARFWRQSFVAKRVPASFALVGSPHSARRPCRSRRSHSVTHYRMASNAAERPDGP